MKALNGIIWMAAALSFGACAPGSSMNGDSSPHPEREPVTVQVQNNNWSDMVVYMVHGSTRVRLGTVTGLNRESFRIPRSAMTATGEVRLFADPIGGSRGYLSDAVTVRPGQRLALEVGHNMNISFISVWN